MKLNKITIFFTMLSIIVCSIVLRDTGEPRPVFVATIGGIIMSLILNAGLILISFEKLKKKFKKIFTVWMIISLIGITFTVGGFFQYLELVAIIFHLWLIVTIWRKNEFQVTTCSQG